MFLWKYSINNLFFFFGSTGMFLHVSESDFGFPLVCAMPSIVCTILFAQLHYAQFSAQLAPWNISPLMHSSIYKQHSIEKAMLMYPNMISKLFGKQQNSRLYCSNIQISQICFQNDLPGRAW